MVTAEWQLNPKWVDFTLLFLSHKQEDAVALPQHNNLQRNMQFIYSFIGVYNPFFKILLSSLKVGNLPNKCSWEIPVLDFHPPQEIPNFPT